MKAKIFVFAVFIAAIAIFTSYQRKDIHLQHRFSGNEFLMDTLEEPSNETGNIPNFVETMYQNINHTDTSSLMRVYDNVTTFYTTKYTDI